METRILIATDVHLCHEAWYEVPSDVRMEKMIADMNGFYTERPYEKIVFLGDYSLDFWGWDIGGSYLGRGISNAENFRRDYASRLKAPFYMIPGNHEQYGEEKWQALIGTPRAGCFEVGGYLIVALDNFALDLDPQEHSDGTYSGTDLAFVRRCLSEHPGLPVILCGHFFDWNIEGDEFFDYLKEEKRIVFLACGHDHCTEVTELGERADGLCIYHCGHYSYAGGGRSVRTVMWGFCEVLLREDGVDIRYIEPENTLTLRDGLYHHEAREQNHRFFKRRDL